MRSFQNLAVSNDWKKKNENKKLRSRLTDASAPKKTTDQFWDVAVMADSNVKSTESEKLEEYQHLD